MTEPILRGRDLTKQYPGTAALQGVDVDVFTGQILSVMGPSGSGKSTLLHCLAGVITPDSGEVWFDGDRIDLLGEAERSKLRRTRFGFLFQSRQLVSELTAAENVALPLLLGGVRRRSAADAAIGWLERVQVAELASRYPGEMSGGQAQRVALARALVIGPTVLFADEPTGALDSLAGQQVMELLVEQSRAQGTAVVLVTHDPRVATYADAEVVVRDGRVSASGGGHLGVHRSVSP